MKTRLVATMVLLSMLALPPSAAEEDEAYVEPEYGCGEDGADCERSIPLPEVTPTDLEYVFATLESVDSACRILENASREDVCKVVDDALDCNATNLDLKSCLGLFCIGFVVDGWGTIIDPSPRSPHIPAFGTPFRLSGTTLTMNGHYWDFGHFYARVMSNSDC